MTVRNLKVCNLNLFKIVIISAVFSLGVCVKKSHALEDLSWQMLSDEGPLVINACHSLTGFLSPSHEKDLFVMVKETSENHIMYVINYVDLRGESENDRIFYENRKEVILPPEIFWIPYAFAEIRIIDGDSTDLSWSGVGGVGSMRLGSYFANLPFIEIKEKTKENVIELALKDKCPTYGFLAKFYQSIESQK
jgi:hypothetical protein